MNNGDVTSCWCTNLLPFREELRKMRDLTQIEDWQLKCVDERADDNLFGIGWSEYFRCEGEDVPAGADNIIVCKKGEKLTDDIVKKCEETVQQDPGFNKALGLFYQIKAGDYVMMRLRNAHFYIGKVKETAYYLGADGPEFVHKRNTTHPLSWACKVEKWIDFVNDEVFPSALVGETYKRCNMTTISRLNSDITKRLMELVMLTPNGEDISDDKKIELNEENFAKTLSPNELEDLVAAYIYAKHDGYLLLPSSCKRSKAKYEFNFVSPDGADPITCQVKNQERIPLESYKDRDGYAVIYLFSGLADWEEQWQKRKQDEMADNVQMITHRELFELLKSGSGSAAYLREKLRKYYVL